MDKTEIRIPFFFLIFLNTYQKNQMPFHLLFKKVYIKVKKNQMEVKYVHTLTNLLNCFLIKIW